MLNSLRKSERGFTLIELMVSLTILAFTMGAVNSVFSSGLKLVNTQSDQVDLRQSSRQIVLQMEKDIQNAYSVDVFSDGVTQEIKLWDSVSHLDREYQYIPNQSKLVLRDFDTNTVKTVASNIGDASFENMRPGITIDSRGLSVVRASLVFAKNQETLQINTNLSPRWNAGNGVPAIIQITPSTFISSEFSYVFTNILGMNTHFDSTSQVYIKEGNTVYATTDPAYTGQTKQLTASADGLTLTNVKIYSVPDTNKLPFGMYDMYVVTGGETVWAYSVFTISWDPNDWQLVGNSQSSGFDSTHFPYVYKDANNNDKVDYYVRNDTVNFDVKVAISLRQDTLANSYAAAPDAEVCLWENPDNGAKNNTYIGYGINKNKVYIRNIQAGVEKKILSNKTVIEVQGVSVNSGRSTLRAVAKADGTIDFYLNNELINDKIDLSNSGNIKIRKPSTWTDAFNTPSPPTVHSYLGVTVPNNKIAASFAVLRM